MSFLNYSWHQDSNIFRQYIIYIYTYIWTIPGCKTYTSHGYHDVCIVVPGWHRQLPWWLIYCINVIRVVFTVICLLNYESYYDQYWPYTHIYIYYKNSSIEFNKCIWYTCSCVLNWSLTIRHWPLTTDHLCSTIYLDLYNIYG